MSGTEERQSDALSEISRGLAGLHTEFYGKGPAKAGTYAVNDTVVCFLEGGFTTVEQTLIREGDAEAVHGIRHSFRAAMEQPFRDVVEGGLGRRVVACISQIHTGPDLAVELFLLEPSTGSVTEVPHADGGNHGSARGEVLARISTALVQLHSRYYGKGPTKAKTFLVHDTVISLLRGGFTTVERTLIDDGDVAPVYQIRRSFQRAMEENFTAVVEGALDRKVIAYMSQVHHDPDLDVELFVLEPSEELEVAEHDVGSSNGDSSEA
jgi:uncharacterized protein YbcI